MIEYNKEAKAITSFRIAEFYANINSHFIDVVVQFMNGYDVIETVVHKYANEEAQTYWENFTSIKSMYEEAAKKLEVKVTTDIVDTFYTKPEEAETPIVTEE